jgi:hypothetical protein
MKPRLSVIIPAACAAALVAGCGSSGKETADTTADTTGGQTGTTPSGTTPGKVSKPKPRTKEQVKKAIAAARGNHGAGTQAHVVRSKGIPPEAPSFVGLFHGRVSAADVKGVPSTFAKAGQWSLILGVSAYNLQWPSGITSGKLRYSGKQLILGPAPKTPKIPKAARKTSHPVPAPCTSGHGVYTFTRAKTTITLKKVSDPCTTRAAVLPRTWTIAS